MVSRVGRAGLGVVDWQPQQPEAAEGWQANTNKAARHPIRVSEEHPPVACSTSTTPAPKERPGPGSWRGGPWRPGLQQPARQRGLQAGKGAAGEGMLTAACRVRRVPGSRAGHMVGVCGCHQSRHAHPPTRPPTRPPTHPHLRWPVRRRRGRARARAPSAPVAEGSRCLWGLSERPAAAAAQRARRPPGSCQGWFRPLLRLRRCMRAREGAGPPSCGGRGRSQVPAAAGAVGGAARRGVDLVGTARCCGL
jgi:hypothetical protein